MARLCRTTNSDSTALQVPRSSMGHLRCDRCRERSIQHQQFARLIRVDWTRQFTTLGGRTHSGIVRTLQGVEDFDTLRLEEAVNVTARHVLIEPPPKRLLCRLWGALELPL